MPLCYWPMPMPARLAPLRINPLSYYMQLCRTTLKPLFQIFWSYFMQLVRWVEFDPQPFATSGGGYLRRSFHFKRRHKRREKNVKLRSKRCFEGYKAIYERQVWFMYNLGFAGARTANDEHRAFSDWQYSTKLLVAYLHFGLHPRIQGLIQDKIIFQSS